MDPKPQLKERLRKILVVEEEEEGAKEQGDLRIVETDESDKKALEQWHCTTYQSIIILLRVLPSISIDDDR